MTVFDTMIHSMAGMHPGVMAVLVVLFFASFLSWTAILHQSYYIYRLKRKNRRFNANFASDQHDLGALYRRLPQSPPSKGRMPSLATLFNEGFVAFQAACRQDCPQDVVIADVQRATRMVSSASAHRLERPLTLFATIASVSPYVGLLGTVVGIMHTLQALGHTQGALQLATVAPGIAEALLTTALGLLTAIPASIAYNYAANCANSMGQQYTHFEAELTTLLYREMAMSHVSKG